jgi:Mrp family chromosome partitioning ATPase
VIYVSKWAATPIPLVEKGIGQLLQNKAPVKGIVLNQMDFDQAKADGQSYDGYYEYHDESRAT